MLEKLGVYICSYNEEENIAECIKSIKNNGIDKIYVVDASNDNTAYIAETLGAHVIHSKKNLSIQKEMAIAHCNKEYIMFVDADDRLHEDCIRTLFNDMKEHHYDVVEVKKKVLNPKSYWEKSWDAVLEHCISIPGPTNMVGGNTLYKREILIDAGGFDPSFGTKNVDSALAIRLERVGAKIGIGNGVCFISRPANLKENIKKFKQYGLGDALLFRAYPEKRKNIILHLIYTYPIKRSWNLILNKKGYYCGIPIIQGLIRFVYMVAAFIKKF